MSVKLYEIGGAVRDKCLDLKPNDIDYAVEASSFQAMRDYLTEHSYQIFQEKPEFGFIKCKAPDNQIVDMTLCRQDGYYTDHRHPDRIELCDIYHDLARRDFTINAMARSVETGELLDPYGAQQDLAAGLIRCVGTAEDRLREDPLRFLRALRFSLRYGYTIDPTIMAVVHQDWFIEIFPRLSMERINGELKKMFHGDTVAALKLFATLPDRFLALVFPKGKHTLSPSMKQNL